MPSMPQVPELSVRAVRATAVEVPLRFGLGTSQGAIRQATLLLIDVETQEGLTGRSYVFAHMPAIAQAIAVMLREIEAQTRGQRATPDALWQRLMKRFTLVGVQGVLRMAIAGFDVAMWDAAALAAKLPLCRLLGADPRPIRAYNSCGLGLAADKDALAAEAERLLERGFGAVKLRLGYPDLGEDLAAVRAVKRRIGKAALMVDYNQALSLGGALLRGAALDAVGGITWLEEPIRHDDYRGASRLRDALQVPIQIGENFNGPSGMSDALAANAADCVMPDLERIVGVSGWRLAAELAAVNRIEMSSHLYPEVSAHLLAATPTSHFLEYVDWADVLLETPLIVENGHALISDRPGNGMTWRAGAVKKFRLR